MSCQASRFFLAGFIAQQRRGMVGRQDLRPLFIHPDASFARDAQIGSDDSLCRRRAQANQYLRPHQHKLRPQIRQTGVLLKGFRHAVMRRAALDDVGDVDHAAVQPDGSQHFVQQLPCRADERPALLVLLLPPAPRPRTSRPHCGCLSPSTVCCRVWQHAAAAVRNRVLQHFPCHLHKNFLPGCFSFVLL